ncbi:MAG: ATPase, T2SS/T4P/T4SS family [Rhodospirillales bacterium]
MRIRPSGRRQRSPATGSSPFPHELTFEERKAAAVELARWIADRYGVAVDPGMHRPDLEAGSNERMAATIPPVTAKPTFAIRKPPAVTFELAAFEPKGGEMPATEEEGRNDPSPGDGGPALTALRRAVAERRNILIAGSTGSGKTSCLSALLQIPSVQRDRCLVLEDTREIAVPAADHVRMLTSPEVPMRALVQLLPPDRIILGEVRSGDAAIELIHAMNTGHSGSFCTVHANSAHDALGRLEDLCAEVCPQPPCRSIATAIGCIAFLRRTSTGREISEVLFVDGWDGGYVVRDRRGENL